MAHLFDTHYKRVNRKIPLSYCNVTKERTLSTNVDASSSIETRLRHATSGRCYMRIEGGVRTFKRNVLFSLPFARQLYVL